jgi:hypothetical protein
VTTWLEPEVVATILPKKVSPRHVRRIASSEGWETRQRLRSRNGRGIVIALESLPEAARSRYYNTIAKQSLPERKPQRTWAHASKMQQARAEARHRAIDAYLTFIEQWRGGRGLASAEATWFSEYFEKAVDDRKLIGLSLRSIKRWLKAFREAGCHIDALVDGNDGPRRGRTSIPPAILAEFEALYYRATKPSVAFCYKQLKRVSRARNWNLPAYDTFVYWVENIMDQAVASYWREPDKRRENLRPFIVRDYDDPEFRAMQIIQSDHHQIDVAVSCGDPFCPVGHYPWITIWIDLRSRKVLAVEVYIEAPNSRRILKLLHRVLVDFGVPLYVYADNGMDYVKAVGRWSVKHFEVGRRGAKNAEVVGWTPDLVERIAGPFGMEAIFSNEGNPQSKLVERFFRTLKDSLYSQFESYRGSLGERTERAEYLRQHPDELPAIAQLALEVDRTVREYNDSPHRGDGMHGRSPNEVFDSTRLPFRQPDAAALAIAFWTEKVGAKVFREGIKHQHRWYALPPDAAVQYWNEKVNIRYDEEAPETIAVYDAAWRFIAIATMRGKAPQHRGDERVANSIEELQHEWHLIQEQIRARHNPIAARRLLEKIGEDLEAYHRHEERLRQAPVAQAVAGGGVVTVVDSYLSPLARQIEAARRELDSFVPRLSAEQLERAAIAEDHTDEYLEFVVPPQLAIAAPITDDEDDDPLVVAAELERIHLNRTRLTEESVD